MVIACTQEHLAASKALISLLKHNKERGKYIAGICAAPAVVFKVVMCCAGLFIATGC